MPVDPTTVHRLGAAAATRVPRSITEQGLRGGGVFASLFAGDRRVIVERNLRRVRGRSLTDAELNRGVAASFEAYARYYADSFRLPDLDARTIDEGFDYVGFDNIVASLERGVGPMLVLPHLGGWEWAAFWLTKLHGIKVTAIVEPLEPPELHEWFVSFRESLGMEVIAVGPEAGPAILRAINDGRVVCLLSDRVVADAAAVPVDFFGERTLAPSGPATIALRTGAPILPTTVYFRDGRHFADCRPPLDTSRQGKFRDDVTRVTQDMVRMFERFIRVAPEQWHVLQPNWPSDFRALGRPIPERYRDLGGGAA